MNAALASYVLLIVLSGAVSAGLWPELVVPHQPWPLGATVLRFVADLLGLLLGGYVAARLAPADPERHAPQFGGVGVSFSWASCSWVPGTVWPTG